MSDSNDSNREGSSAIGFGSSIKSALRGVGRQIRKALADDKGSPETTEGQSEEKPPAYRREGQFKITLDPNVTHHAPDTVGRDLAFHLTGTDGGTPVTPANLVIGSKGRTMTLQERISLVQKYLEELDSSTADAPAGGFPPHSAELFKVKQLVTTLLVLTNIKTPPTGVSQEYLKKVRGLTAIHESMLEKQKEWTDGQQ